MAEYLRTFWHHQHPEDPVELYYEIQSDRSVTRIVELFPSGKLIADSLDLAAVREPNLANNVCLCDGEFPAPELYAEAMAAPEFGFEPITKDRFDALFQRSLPKTIDRGAHG